MRALVLSLALLPLLLARPAAAEIYKWIDESGRMNFAQNLNQVPARYRAQAEAAARSGGSGSASPKVQTYSNDRAPASRQAPPASAGGASSKTTRVRVQRAGTSMLVNVRLNNSVTAPFLIDTGASDVLVSEGVARQLGLDFGADARTKRYSTANGIVEHPVVTLRTVSLGGATVENVPASVSPNMEVGLLGLSFFNHFTYNIDAAAGIVTLTPNQLASQGMIRGGRSEAQWRSEYGALRWRIARVEDEYATKAESKARERRRLEGERQELERQLSLLDTEADRARVPMSWRH
jgi:clan AA aspartic protease (TIGR02281 family)